MADHADLAGAAKTLQLAFVDVAVAKVVFWLYQFVTGKIISAAGLQRGPKPRCTKIRGADHPHFPFLDQLSIRSQRFLDVHGLVVAMRLWSVWRM